MKYYIILILCVIGCHCMADTHHGKMTRQECSRILDKQTATYHGQHDETLPPGDPQADYGSNKPNPKGNNK